MCTLGGIASINGLPVSSKIEVLQAIINRLDLRGRDAFGCFVMTRDGTCYKETDSDKNVITEMVSSLYDKGVLAVVATGRAIPASERVFGDIHIERDTQPFFDRNNGWVVSHNGIIANDNILCDRYSLRRVGGSPVDTAIMPDLLGLRGAKQAIEDLEGSFALAMLNTKDKQMVFATNFMPLYIKKADNAIMWGSMDIMLPEGAQQLPYYSVMTARDGKVGTYSLPNRLDSKKVVVVCSGGLDSVTTLFLYKALGYDVTMLHFNYGQAAEEVEDFSTGYISKYYGIDRYVIDARGLIHQISTSSPILGSRPRGERHWDMETTYSYVGARNLIFTSIAMSLAERLGAGKVALGLNIDDSTYPDNNLTYINEISKVGSLSLNWNNRVEVRAPLVNLTKKEIIEVAIAVGSPLHLQVSCYYPKLINGKIYNCGKCGCDKLREYSFKALRLKDPIPYLGSISWDGCDEIPTTGSSDKIPYLEYLRL